MGARILCQYGLDKREHDTKLHMRPGGVESVQQVAKGGCIAAWSGGG